MSSGLNLPKPMPADSPVPREWRASSSQIAPVSVVIAEPHQYSREGLRSFLAAERGIAVVGTAADSVALLALVAEHRPDVAIASSGLLGLPALDTLRRLRALAPRTCAVIIDQGVALDARHPIAVGACAFLSSEHTVPELLRAVSAIAHNHLSAAPPAASDPHSPESAPDLTGRERDLLRLIAEGCSNGEIGAHLGIAVKTVETHRRTLYRKLGVHNASELLMRALRLRLISP